MVPLHRLEPLLAQLVSLRQCLLEQPLAVSTT
jgi:hypothetical protein